MKNKRINIIILLLALGLVLYFTLKDNFKGIIIELSRVNILIFVVAVITFILSLLFKSFSLHLFLKECKKNYSLKNTFELTLMGQFLNGITPFQTGGQPFQIYLLKKQGVRLSDSTRAMIKDFISFQTALILIGVVSLVLDKFLNVLPNNPYLNLLIQLGFLVNGAVLVFLFFVTCAKNLSIKITNKILDFVFNFKILKNKQNKKKNLISGLEHFYESGSELRNNKKNLVIAIFTNVINLLLLYFVPFIIFKSFGQSGINLLSSTIITTFVMLVGSFVPIPGATGGLEYSFIQFFSSFSFNPSVLSGAMLLWRFTTYFFGMFIGFMTLVLKKGVGKK